MRGVTDSTAGGSTSDERRPLDVRGLRRLVAGGVAALSLVVVGGLLAATWRADATADTAPPSLIADGARVLVEHGAAAPTQEPPYLTLIFPLLRAAQGEDPRTVGIDAAYHHGAVVVRVCDSPSELPVSTTICATDGWSVFREERVGDRLVQVAVDSDWNVPAGTTEVPEGDRIAEGLWWWSTVPFRGTTAPAWLADEAADAAPPGSGMFG